MITFLDENDVEYGALATIKATNAVNGERSLTGTIVSGDYVLSNIERGWRLRFDDEYYVVTYAKPIDEGGTVQVEFDAVHQFFWDFDKSSVYDQLTDGSHTFAAYLDFIFKNSGYSYTVDSALNVHAFEKQSFGFKKRLTLFNDIITSTGVEFQVNGKVVRILAKVGTDLSTVVRKNFNLNELGIEKNIGDFVTYQKGFGAYFGEEDHSKGRLEVEYTSPLASIYGKLEAEPLVDERYSQSSSLLAVLKENVDNSYTISVSLDMEDLTRAGYKYKQPVAGDYIMAINETLDFQEKIRIVSFTSEYDVQGILVKHEVTCNDIGSVKKLSASYTHTQHQAANAEVNANIAYEFANKALVSADGKNTNYYGDSFPVDNPKGTLKKGDLLFLTVGDTVKQYYWNGADWIINPVLDDVEAFKEQIAEELKDVPNREEFENKIAEELATSKAEIETQIESAKTQAESNAKEYADTINQETAKVAELANAAAGEIKADLVNVKNNLTATSIVANNAQAAADAAKRDLADVTSDLNTAKQDLISHAQQLQTQANVQTELTKRVTTVESTANGTKTTVSELTKTVAQNGKDITSVTARTKVVEDDLSGTKTTLSQVQTTADSASQKTATLETGLNGVKADLTATTATANTTKTNLANYQASNDRAVANLQSNLQTANGNISSLKTKVEAVPGQITSAVSAVEGKIPTSAGGRNLAQGTSKDWSEPFTGFSGVQNTTKYVYRVLTDGLSVGDTIKTRIVLKYTDIVPASGKTAEIWMQGPGNITGWNSGTYPSGGGGRRSISGSGEIVFELTDKITADHLKNDYWNMGFRTDWIASGSLEWRLAKAERGMFFTDWSPAPEDTAEQISNLSSEIKQTTDEIKASVSSLDSSTVKSSSLTINADGIVMKAGKSTTDVANAIGSYFAVNQNAINLFSDKINVKGNMIVNGAITSDKIASKQINTAHLNGKIITADVIATNAITADAIKAGAVTTDKMSANSINGDRIAAGTLDAAKIKAGSITASQIASGTITSAQIKAGTISAANIASGAITSDKIAANSIDASKIAANAITANMIRGGQLNSTNGATVFDLNAGTLTFNNNYGYIQRVASDKVFEITTYLSTSSGSQEHLTSAFNIRKSDNSRQAGVKFTLYNTVENKPTAEAIMNADALILYDSQNTRLFSVYGKSTFVGGFNTQGWGDIPIAKVHGGLVVDDIGIGGHTKSLLKIVEELCKKAGILWV